MSEFDAQRVAERIDIVLDIVVAGDYHSAIRGRFNNRAFRFSYLRMPGASVFFY